jgi:hypothetical protein
MSEEQNFQDPAAEPGQEGIQDQAYEQQPAVAGEDPQAYAEQPAAEPSPFDEAAFDAAGVPPAGSVPPPALGSVPPPALGSVPPPDFGSQPVPGSVPPPAFGSQPVPGSVPPPAADFGGGVDPAADFGGGDFGGGDFGGAEASPAAPAFEPPPEPEPAPKKKKKRRKIDLKSRLSNVRASGRSRSSGEGDSDAAAFPPPPTTGSVPPPKVLGPMPAVASPFAPPEPEEKPTAQQQTIQVDAKEIHEARSAVKKKFSLYIAAAALAALIAGFFVGQTKARGDVGRKAVAGATALSTDIDAANKVMIDLSDALRQSIEELQADTYPEKLSEVLKATNVPFSGANYQGKGVGGLPGDVLQGLLAYTKGVDELNKRKDSLRNLLGAAKKQFEKYVAQKKKPVVNFSVVFTKQGGKMVAELVPNKKPFAMKDKWPEKYKVLRLVGKKPKDVEVKMWKSGDKLTGDPPPAVPMEERTVSTFTSQKLVFGLKKALIDTKALVDGNQSQIPSEQTDGLIKDGERIVEQLKKVARAGQ